jgi:hypothetical protein
MNRIVTLILGLSLCVGAPALTAGAQDPDQRVTGNKFPIDFSAPRGHSPADAAQKPRSGSLAIRAVQGTEGGPPIANVSVEVELYHRGMIVDTVKSELDEHGVVIIEDLPVAMGLQPVVRVLYNDVTYQQVGDLMDRMHPEQTLEIVCYELTTEEPPWRVRMRHVMIAAVAEGLHVTEVMAVENLSDRTWLGTPTRIADKDTSEERSVTTQFALPDRAFAVTLGRGFHDWCCTTMAENRLKNHLPLMPGTTEMIYSYAVPSRRGTAALDMINPGASGGVDHLMVLVPATLETVSVSGLELVGTDMMGETPVRMYSATGVKGDDIAHIALTGLARHEGAGAAVVAKAAAAIGGIVIVLFAAGMIFVRPAKKGATAEAISAAA